MTDNAQFYSLCNLNENPFRSNATFDDDPRVSIWAGYEKEQMLFQKFLIRSRAEQVGNTNFLLLYGDYGTGKSHALLWASHWLRGYGGDAKSVAYLIPTLKKDKGRLTFAGAFKDDLLAKTTLLDDVVGYQQFLGRCVVQYVQEKNLGTDAVNDDVIEKMLPSVELYNFAKRIYSCKNRDEVQHMLAPGNLSDYQAMINFTRLVNLFVYEMRFVSGAKRFRQSVHLFIDEFDDIRNASSKEVLEANDLLRHIYDYCPNCFGLVVAMSVVQEVIPTIMAEYVIGRVNRQIEFAVLDRSAASDFVIKIMDERRLSKGDVNMTGAYPFTRDAVDVLVGQITFRTPRKIVNIMQEAVEEIRLAGLDPTQRPVGIKDLDDHGILEQIWGNGH
jgi:hypothetical protein